MTQEDKAVIYLHFFLLHSATSSSSSPLNSFCLGTFGFYWLALFIRSLLRFGSPRQPFLLSAALFPRHSLKSHSSQISLFPGPYFLPLSILFSFSRLSHLRSLLPPTPPSSRQPHLNYAPPFPPHNLSGSVDKLSFRASITTLPIVVK